MEMLGTSDIVMQTAAEGDHHSGQPWFTALIFRKT